MEFHIAGFEQYFEKPSGGAHFLSNGYVTITATGLGSGYVWLAKGPWNYILLDSLSCVGT